MEDEVKKYLFDIRTCLDKIELYVGSPKMFSVYEQNFMLQQAVERNIEIIGEAINGLLKIVPDIAITNARKIVDTRNRLIHGYNEIEPVQIWNIIINHLPLLKQEVEKLLE